jgi:bifunctional DNase/RNase
VLVEVEYEGMVKFTDGDFAVLLKEKGGERRCPIVFREHFLISMLSALHRTAPRGLLVGHSAFTQFLLEDLGIVVNKVTIPDTYQETDEDERGYRMFVHFNTPAGMIEREWWPSDALPIALCTHCPIFVSPTILDEVAEDGAKMAAFLNAPRSDDDLEQKAEDAARDPSNDKLPKA